MIFTDPSLLPVPDENDTGATALFLQAFAERTEAVLSAQYDALEDALTSPMVLMTNSAITNISNSFSADTFGSLINTNTDTYRSNNGAAGSRALYKTGLWQVGYSFTATCTGTVTNNTYRAAHMPITVNDIFTNVNVLEYDIRYTTTELSNTATSLSAEQLIFIPADTPAASNGSFATFSLGLSHGNTGSTMTIAANNAKVWAFWISDDNLIRAV